MYQGIIFCSAFKILSMTAITRPSLKVRAIGPKKIIHNYTSLIEMQLTAYQFHHWFGCLKEPSYRDGSFKYQQHKYPQHKFWMGNTKTIIAL